MLLVLKSYNAIGWTQPKTGKPRKIQFPSAYNFGEVSSQDLVRGCLHDTRATFALERVHSGSLSWLYICLHDIPPQNVMPARVTPA